MDLARLIPQLPALPPLPLLVVGGSLLLVLLYALAVRRPARRAGPAPTPPAEPPAQRPAAPYLPYVGTPQLLTRTERAFLATLQMVVPIGWHVFPQVALANLVHVEQRARGNPEHLGRIQGRCVDFVICEPRTTAPRLAIELEDGAPTAAERHRRDRLVEGVLRKAGLPLMYVQARDSYDEEDLRTRLRGYLGIVSGPAMGETQPAVPIIARRARPPQPAAATVRLGASCRACQGAVEDDEQYCSHCGAPVAGR